MLKSISILLLVAFCFLKQTAAGAAAGGPTCTTVMYSKRFAGLPPSFPGVVAHGVHSITVPDINYYFPNDQDDIYMPVVNPDMVSMNPILFRPPNFEHTFNTPALRVVDQVLSHMNDPHRDMSLYTNLEKIVHASHMQDVWQQASTEYK